MITARRSQPAPNAMTLGWTGIAGRKRAADIAVYLVLIAFGCVFLFPLAYLIARSLMSQGETFTQPPRFIPDHWLWSNYRIAWGRAPFPRFLLNTMVIASLQVIGTTFSASLCAFGFARLRFPGRNLLFAIVLATLMLPGTVTLIPLYILFKHLHWLNTMLPLTVPSFFGGGAFAIFLFRQFFNTIPRDLDEAATMDGASSWQVYREIIMPLSMPVITVVSILTFLAAWTDLFGPLIYLNTPDKWTLAQGVYNVFTSFYGPPQVPYVAAISMLLIVPPLVLYAFAQRYLIEGVVTTGIKG